MSQTTRDYFSKYEPASIDTKHVALNPEIAKLIEKLARNAHDNWAKLRIQEGWHYGPRRDDLRKQHPNLLPYEELSDSEKQYDRETVLETVKALLAMGYVIEPVPTSTSSANLTPAFPKLPTAVLQLLTDSSMANRNTLLQLWRAHNPDVWSSDPEPFQVMGERMLGLGEPLIAYDVVTEGIKLFPQDIRLRQLLALAQARSGATGPANAVLERLYQEGHQDEETLGLLARTYKDLGSKETDDSKVNQHFRRGYELYAQAYETSGGYWSGINAATLALLLGQKDHATALAGQVRAQCRQKLRRAAEADAERYWLISTLGEASLLLGDWQEAENYYGQAVELRRGDWGTLQSTRRNARLLMRSLASDKDQARIEHLFRFPSVVIFVGHMIDQPGRTVPRFPPRIEPVVKDAIREYLQKVNAGFGYASAACGSDILLHEVIQEMKGDSFVILPYQKERFVRECVRIIPGSDWGERFEKTIAQAIDTQEVSKEPEMSNLVSYEFSNLMLHGLASIRAQQLETKLVPLAVWDGREGDGAGGTAATVKRWQLKGLQVEVIDLAKILLGHCPDLVQSTPTPPAWGSVGSNRRPSEFSPEIRALLFADVEGFSKLTGEQVHLFVTHFLGLAGRLANESVHQPLSKNTWGDGLFLVFSNVNDAGQFALDLCDAVGHTNWSEHGLPNLKIRIGLHAGPVYCCCDPVTLQTNYVGANVSRAARIEPVTPAGQVYASEAFAALAAAEGTRDFRCDYVGQTAMAKKYGTFPTYIVLRRRQLNEAPGPE